MSGIVPEDLSIIITNTTVMSVNGKCRQAKMRRRRGPQGPHLHKPCIPGAHNRQQGPLLSADCPGLTLPCSDFSFCFSLGEGIWSLSSASAQGSPSPPSICTPAQHLQAHSCRLLHRTFQSTEERKRSWRGARHRGRLPPPAQAEVEILQNLQELQIGLGKTEETNFTSSPPCVSKAFLCPSIW